MKRRAGGSTARHNFPNRVLGLALAALGCLSAPAFSASSYVPPLTSNVTTTIASVTTSANSSGRVGVDKAGNVFYINHTTPYTLYEIPFAAPAALNASPIPLLSGLGQYNANAAFVDVSGNLWVTDGNGSASLIEIPAANGIPNTAAITTNGSYSSSTGLAMSNLVSTACTATSTVPCTWSNGAFANNLSGYYMQVSDVYSDGVGNVYVIDVYDNTSKGNYNRVVKFNTASAGTGTLIADEITYNVYAQIAADQQGNVIYADSYAYYGGGGAGGVYDLGTATGLNGGGTASAGAVTGIASLQLGTLTGTTPTTVGSTAAVGTTGSSNKGSGVVTDMYGNLYISSMGLLAEVPNESALGSCGVAGLCFADQFIVAKGLGSCPTAFTSSPITCPGTSGSGVTTAITSGGSVSANGNYYYIDSNGNTGFVSDNIVEMQVNNYNFGNVAVGSLVTSPILSLYPQSTLSTSFTSQFPTASRSVNTLSAYLQSFPWTGLRSWGGGSTFTGGTTYTLNMDFAPIHSGLLKGSFTPRDGSANIQTTLNLFGTGTGPQSMFLPGVATQLATYGWTSSSKTAKVNLSAPSGITVDTFGDVFFADSGNSKVVAYCMSALSSGNVTTNSFCTGAGYGGSPIELGTGFTAPAGIALDGANSLYVTDSAANTVTKIQGDNLTSLVLIPAATTFGGTKLSGPTGIALDGYTNIYITDTANNRIVEAHQFGATFTDNAVLVPSTTLFGGTALKAPTGLGLDVAGDLFIADTGNNRIVEYSTVGVTSVVSTTGITLSAPTGVAVLPSGALVVTDAINGVSLVNGGTGSALTLGSLSYTKLAGVGLDLSGNIYVTDPIGNQVIELNVNAPATAPAFASTPQSTSSLVDDTTYIFNGGFGSNGSNGNLSFSIAPSITVGGTNFALLSNTCSTSTPLSPNAQCVVTSYFTPTVLGALTGTISATDNQVGIASLTNIVGGSADSEQIAVYAATSTPTIALSGTGSAPLTAQTITFSPSVLTYPYSAVSFALSATSTSGLTVSFASTTPTVCTVAGTTASIWTGGICSIVASQAGNTTYAPATSITVNFTINGAPQVIVISPVSGGSYARTLGTITLSATNTLSGLPVTFSSTTGSVCTVTGTTVSLLTAGTCTVEADAPANTYFVVGSVLASYTITNQGQTITFPAISTQTYSPTATVSLSATATSSLAVSYASNSATICSVSGAPTVVNMLSAGTCSITASQAGNTNYAAAAPVTNTFTISPAPQTITFAPSVTSYPYSATGTFSLSGSTGVATTVVFASTTSGICTVSGTTATIVAGGTCTITANAAATTNYTVASQVSVNYTITPIAQTITFAPTTTSYPFSAGGTFPVSGTSNSGLTVSFASATTGVCTIASGTVTIVSGGTCTISATQAGNASYNAATPVPVNFTITPIAQTITFAPSTVSYPYTPSGTFSVSATTTSNLAVSFASSTASVCTVSGTTVTIVAPGTCTITASQAGNASYTVATAVPANITITLAAQTITFTSPSTLTYTPTTTLSATGGGSGNAVVFSVASGPASVSGTNGTTLTLTGIGAVVINANEAGNSNYLAGSTTQTITVNPLGTVVAPVFNVAAGTYTTIQSVSLSDTQTGAAIYYTTNGSTPTANSTLYAGTAITVAASQTVNAIALVTGYTPSAVVPAAYVINLPLAATPTFSVAGGVYTAGQTVALSDTTTGAKIYYTTNFTTPTTSSTLYTTPIAVSASETINAIAVAYNYSNSTMASAAYIVNLPPPSFTASVTPSALTISATGTGSVAVSITPSSGFSSAVTFSCSGLPINATCTFNPAIVTPTGGVANTTMTITTNALIASEQRKSNPYFPEGATFAIALCFFGWKRRRAFQLVILLAVSVVGLTLFSGCGGSSTVAQSSTSMVTVTGTAGAQQASTTFTLTLQ